MQYTPKEIKYNVNITHEHPLKEFVTLFIGLVLILVITYFVLGIILSFIIARMPERFENTISNFYSLDRFELVENNSRQLYLQEILDKLLANMPDDSRTYRVLVGAESDPNAFALPGGTILIFSGLVDQADSENEIAMILAHELGHFANNDHLRGLSRGIVIVFISAVVFGNNSSVTDFVSNLLTRINMTFSREQERAADLYGLDLLNRAYGHVAGATDFFERVQAQDKYMKYLKFMSTHPLSEERIAELNTTIAQKGYVRKEKIPVQLNKSDEKAITHNNI